MEFGLVFSEPREVNTKFGPKLVRDAIPTQEFKTAWEQDSGSLRKRGYSYSQWLGKWKVSFWGDIPAEVKEARAVAVAASHATDAEIDVPVPEGLALLPFQKAGIAYALKRDGTLIGDEMGLGKTIQAIGVANATGAKRILVVAPATLLLNWRNEILRWQTLGLPVTIVRPGMGGFSSAPGWYLINYEITHKHVAALHADVWDLAVFDECHKCKTRNALRTVSLWGGKGKRIVDGKEQSVTFEPVPAVRKLALTGTPILNRPSELFTILHYLNPKHWPNAKKFDYRYCWTGYDCSGAIRLDELNSELRQNVMVRRLKADVLKELPAKRRQIVELEIETLEAKAAVADELATEERTREAIEQAQSEKMRAEISGDKAAYEAAVASLRKAQAVAFEEMARVRHETAVAKIPAVIEWLKDVEGKALVFAHHRDVLDALEQALAPEGVVRIDGLTPMNERIPRVTKFQEDASIKWFVGGITAAGVGLTLTAASQVYFAELDWVPANVTQAEDRAHRIGQYDSVNIAHLVFNGSLDSKMAKMLVAKQAIADQALDARQIEKAAPVSAPVAPAIEAPAAQMNGKPAGLSLSQIKAIHEALRIVAGYDVDRARELNGMGFSKFDTEIGCKFAALQYLSQKQAMWGRKIVQKYKKQYPGELFAAMFDQDALAS